jgi:hypothetical protein
VGSAITGLVSHEVIDQRSLELHREVVRRLRADPTLLDIARQNLLRWLARPGVGDSLEFCYREWLKILNTKTAEDIFELLSSDTEEARRLRQNSPFAGILSPREVWEIKRRFHNASH